VRKKNKKVEFRFDPRDHSLQVSETLVRESGKDANGLSVEEVVEISPQIRITWGLAVCHAEVKSEEYMAVAEIAQGEVYQAQARVRKAKISAEWAKEIIESSKWNPGWVGECDKERERERYIYILFLNIQIKQRDHFCMFTISCLLVQLNSLTLTCSLETSGGRCYLNWLTDQGFEAHFMWVRLDANEW